MSPTCKTDFKSLKKKNQVDFWRIQVYHLCDCLVIQFIIPFCTEMSSLQIIQVDN